MENEDFVGSMSLSESGQAYVVKTSKNGKQYKEYLHNPLKSKNLPDALEDKSNSRKRKAASVINRYEYTVKKDEQLVQMLWDDYYAALEQRDKEREAEIASEHTEETTATEQTAAAETGETPIVGHPEDDPIDPENPVGSQPQPEPAETQ